MTARTASGSRPMEERWTTRRMLMAAGVKIFRGSGVSISTAGDATAGFVVPANGTANQKFLGTAEEDRDNTNGAAGALAVNVDFIKERTILRFANDTGTPVARADVGKPAYILDSGPTVNAVAAGHVAIGTILDVDATDGVAVEI